MRRISFMAFALQPSEAAAKRLFQKSLFLTKAYAATATSASVAATSTRGA